MSIANLAANLQGSISQLSGALGLKTSNFSPKYNTSQDKVTVPAEFQRAHWAGVFTGQYAFGVANVSEGNTLSIDAFVNNIVGSLQAKVGSGNGDGSIDDFQLPITPQEITQTEEFAVAIKPTHGGTIVNHSGNKYKTLQISGTTGVHPFKRSDGVSKTTGIVLNKPDELKYRSGYEVFQHFRAWIKGYHEQKKFPLNQNKRMIFRNFKDWEFLYVEPLKFTMKRSAAKPLLYDYVIQFKVLGHVTKPKNKLSFDGELSGATIKKAAKAVDNLKNLLKKTRGEVKARVGDPNALIDKYAQVGLAVKNVQSEPFDMADFNKKILAEATTTNDAKAIMKLMVEALRSGTDNPLALSFAGGSSADLPSDPAKVATALEESANIKKDADLKKASDAKAFLGTVLDSLSSGFLKTLNTSALSEEALEALRQEQREAASISRAEVIALRDETAVFAAELANASGLGNDQYDKTYGLTTVSPDDIGDIPDSIFDSLYALSEGEKALDMLLSTDIFFDTNAASLEPQGENTANAVGSDKFSLPDPTVSTREGVVPTGVTLERIAESELGDATRWTELAELNALKAPYIVDDTSSGLAVTFTVESSGFNDPANLIEVPIGNTYVINDDPTAAGAWTGKGLYIADYLGGPLTATASWRYRFPEAGTIVFIVDRDEYLQFTGTQWIDFDPVTGLQQDGVLRPGDSILLPTNTTPSSDITNLGPRDNIHTNGLTQSEKSLAVDLKVNGDGDLELLPRGDFAVSTGTTNGAQAIVLKLLYNKGSYPGFPFLGSSLGIGGKIPSLAQIRSEVLTSLLQDPRISNVSDINLLQQNSSLSLSFTVVFKDFGEPVPVTIPVG